MASTTTFIPNPFVGAEWEASIEAQHAVDEVAAKTAVVAQALAPVDTGALRDSISARPVDGVGAKAEIVAEVPYAAFVEFGTSDTSAQPFLRPALDAAAGI